jgi:UDP-glucuronate 4-epimerase
MYLVTGAAGFIGYHTARALLARGDAVIGIDNLSSYYSPALKRARLAELTSFTGFTFRQVDIADRDALRAAVAGQPVRRIIHLAAQAGVRHSLTHPEDYASANLVGHLNMLELGRHQDGLELMVYASSSSVYGGNTKLPFSETDPVDRPVSLYAASKRADELMSYSYAHLYWLPLIGLRFFTVYGPWGRPDMAMWLFADAILEGRPIQVFNYGEMRRDFTYVDDIVAGILLVADGRSPASVPPHRLYNIGSHHPENLTHMIGLLEAALGKKAKRELLPLQPGDVVATYADIDAISADYGFKPTTPIEVGIPKFVDWFRAWRGRTPP